MDAALIEPTAIGPILMTAFAIPVACHCGRLRRRRYLASGSGNRGHRRNDGSLGARHLLHPGHYDVVERFEYGHRERRNIHTKWKSGRPGSRR